MRLKKGVMNKNYYECLNKPSTISVCKNFTQSFTTMKKISSNSSRIIYNSRLKTAKFTKVWEHFNPLVSLI